MSFALVVGGGLSELGTSLFMLISINAAVSYDINAGIATATMPLSSAFVAIIAHFRYHEKLNYVHLLGLVIVIAGAVVIALFPAHDPDTDAAKTATTAQTCTVLGLGSIAALCLSSEMLISRALAERGADGRFIGLNFLIPEGIIGTAGLLILTCTGAGFAAVGLNGTLLMILAGATGVLAVGQLQYAISIGIVGIASAIFNTNSAWFSLLCFFFLDEALSVMQGIGIAITLVGAAALSLDDDIFRCKRARTQRPVTKTDEVSTGN